ncbi:hypothetical protein [Streptomyces sp. KL118A]|uniref:hypothetical protein n=1 Tax=Streptomyces sp. KL118A TaxID=3045153 RepID=UPI00278BC195|nr:hypothetical protein [Streptomyces sp. KL118A]
MTHLLDLIHPDAGTVLISEWRTGTPERTRAAADAVIQEWAAAEPPPARLAQHLFVATDGTGLLHYAQWTSDEDHLAWARAHRTAVISRVDTLVPGIERPGLNRTRLHRSVVHDAGPRPGVFAVTMTTAVEEMVENADTPVTGLLATHIHLAADGGRAIVVSEWTDATAHETAAADAPGVRTYTLHHSLTP